MKNRSKTYRHYALWIRSLSFLLVGVLMLSSSHQTLGQFIHFIEHTFSPPAVILQHQSAKEDLSSLKEIGSDQRQSNADHKVYALYLKSTQLLQGQLHHEGLDSQPLPAPVKTQLIVEKHWFFQEFPASTSLAFEGDDDLIRIYNSHLNSRKSPPPDIPPKI